MKAKTSFNFIISWNSEVGFFKAYTKTNVFFPQTLCGIDLHHIVVFTF